MTHQEKLKRIKEKCAEANQEIMELKFGCEIEMLFGPSYDPDYGIAIILAECGVCSKHKRCDGEKDTCDMDTGFMCLKGSDEDGWCTFEVKSTDKYKILGRPIRLADVLLAINQANDTNQYSGIGNNGHFTTDFGEKTAWSGDGNNQKAIMWNLRADDLEKQSEEMIEFLYQLLK